MDRQDKILWFLISIITVLGWSMYLRRQWHIRNYREHFISCRKVINNKLTKGSDIMSKKKSQLQEQVENDELELLPGQQMDLIDIAPENAKEIIAHARIYKAVQAKRILALEEEKKEKQKLLELIKEANLQRLEDGKIKFKLDGYTITVTPRDELVQIKEDEGDAEAD